MSLYRIQPQTQVEPDKFVNSYVKGSDSVLNYQQTHIIPTRENSRRIKSAIIDVANITLPPYLVSTLMAHLSGCDSLTFSSYRSIKTLSKKTRGRQVGRHLSASQTKERNRRLVSLGWLHKGKAQYQGTCTYTVLLDNLYDHPEVLKRHKLLPGQNPGICGTRADMPSATPDITTIVVSSSLQSIKEEKEVSINTNNETNFLINDSSKQVPEVIFETTEPIPIEGVSFRQVTFNNIRKKIGLYGVNSFDFLEKCEKGYRYKYRDGTTRTIDHWNGDFVIFCEAERRLKNKIGTRYIEPYKRLKYNENPKLKIKMSNPVVALKSENRELKEGETLRIKGEIRMTTMVPWTEEEDHEAAIELAALLKKLGGKPAKDTLAWEYYMKESLLTPSLEEC